jgi:energy-coupling factor transporter ATP-binding protein EcfA2
MCDQPAIHAEGLSKRFGDVHALQDLNLTVPRASVLGLLGPNGAGKTTTVRILTTLLRPDTGHAQVAGLDVVRQPATVRQVIRLDSPATASRAAELVAHLADGPPQVDAQAGEVTVPVTDGVAVLPGVARRLDAAGLALSDLALRRPTLDDVFLTLTGQATQPPDPADAPATDQPTPVRQSTTGSPA